MTMRDEVVRVRRDRIIEILAVPRSIKDVANEVGCSYHTARNDLADMVKGDLVRITGGLSQKGEALYASGGKRPMPVFTTGTTQITMIEVVKWFARTDAVSGEENIRMIYRVVLEMMNIANNDVQSATPKDLQKIRQVLTKAKMTVDQAASIATQMLDNQRLWDPNQLYAIAADEDFNSEVIDKAYNRFLTYEEQRKAISPQTVRLQTVSPQTVSPQEKETGNGEEAARS